jgi:hypothetical protein
MCALSYVMRAACEACSCFSELGNTKLGLQLFDLLQNNTLDFHDLAVFVILSPRI